MYSKPCSSAVNATYIAVYIALCVMYTTYNTLHLRYTELVDSYMLYYIPLYIIRCSMFSVLYQTTSYDMYIYKHEWSSVASLMPEVPSPSRGVPARLARLLADTSNLPGTSVNSMESPRFPLKGSCFRGYRYMTYVNSGIQPRASKRPSIRNSPEAM